MRSSSLVRRVIAVLATLAALVLYTPAPAEAVTSCSATATVSPTLYTTPRTWISWSTLGTCVGSVTYDVQLRDVFPDWSDGYLSPAVKLHEAPTAWFTATTTRAAFYNGSSGDNVSVRVRARDAAGVSAWSAWRPFVLPFDDTGLAVSSGWALPRGSQFYGGGYRLTKTAGAKAWTSNFGERIEIFGAKTYASGRAKVYVDGVLKVTFDAYAQFSTYRARLAVIEVPYGWHKVEIVNEGTPGRPSLMIDAIGWLIR